MPPRLPTIAPTMLPTMRPVEPPIIPPMARPPKEPTMDPNMRPADIAFLTCSANVELTLAEPHRCFGALRREALVHIHGGWSLGSRARVKESRESDKLGE